MTQAMPDVDTMRGEVLPRLAPTPLVSGMPGGCPCGCALTPERTYGFDVIDFARDVLMMPLDPWQEYVVIHAGELLPDGRPRFKKILLIVARQNGKTSLLQVLTLYWLFVDQWPVIVGQHTRVGKAKEVWEAAYSMALRVPELKAEIGVIRKDNNDPHWRVASGGKYSIEAANANGGRGGSVDRLVVDELRQQKTWEAHSAAAPTLNARPYGQGWWISNQGDSRSVVLVSMRATGVSNIENPEDPVDPELGLFEYSASPGSDMCDPRALAMANPNAGVRISMRSLLADARATMESGDRDRIAKFKTEILCMFVPALDGAIDPVGWKEGNQPGDMAAHRSRVAMVPELSPDGLSASILVAAEVQGKLVRVEVLASWQGNDAAASLRRGLRSWVMKIRPGKLGWIASGGMQALATELEPVKLGMPGLVVEKITADLAAVCMGFAERVEAREVLHSGQERLDQHALGVQKLWRNNGATWVFSRKGDGHADAVYGAAGAVHLARTMPPPAGRLQIVRAAVTGSDQSPQTS